MADVRTASTGDGIPLLDPDGGGVYNVGRNNSHDIRYGLLSGLFGSLGSSFSSRSGVLARSYSGGAIGVGSLKVTQNGTANRFINVAGGISLHTRTAEGPYPAYFPATINIEAIAADATNPRIDSVVARLYDKAAFPADAFHGPYIEILEGVAAASPVPRSIPDGAVWLADLARDAGVPGDTITDAKITDRRKAAYIAGTPRLLLPGDSAADVGYVPGEQRYRIVSGTLLPMEYWGADSLWHGTVVKPYDATTFDLTSGIVSKVISTITIPDPGWPYRIRSHGALVWTQGVNTYYDIGIRQTDASGATWGQAAGYANGGGGAAADIFRQVDGSNGTGNLTGATTVCLCLIRMGGSDPASGTTVQSSVYNRFTVDVVPV